MAGLMGIDLNGLRDVSVDTVDKGVLRGGDVPSVVIVQPRQIGAPLRVIAGAEAAMAVEGRGWHWPDSARVEAAPKCLRVPIKLILEALAQDRRIDVAADEMSPTELLAAAVGALARPRGSSEADTEDRPAVIAIPDDGRFLEDARQRLINAAVLAGVSPTLLWRPVAALLGLEPKLSTADVAKLADCTVGVLSCLEDGVHASRLNIEVKTDRHGSYIVPVRKSAGVYIPYRRSLGDLAADIARLAAPPDDPQNGWQLLWGNGLAFRWVLRLPAKDTVVQTAAGWQLVSGKPPQDPPQVEFSHADLLALNDYLDGVDHRLYEGPALEASCCGDRLAYFLRSRDPKNTHSLYITTNELFTARGCAIYQQRRVLDRHTYFDHLPQLRLAVRHGDDPVFINLIDPEARVEGGTIYETERDLGLSVQPGTSALNFYLLREGNAKPRHVHQELPERITSAVPVRVRIRQQPAQGTARLTLLAAGDEHHFRPIDLSWERMTEEDLTEKEVLERLREAPADVPPVQPQPCHALLWTTPITTAGGSLAQLVPKLAQQLPTNSLPEGELLALLKGHALLLTRRSSPAILTQQYVGDWKLYRAVSSDGELPGAHGDLAPALIQQFDACIKGLDRLMASGSSVTTKVRDAIIRFSGWCFLLCPNGVRRHMLVDRH